MGLNIAEVVKAFDSLPGVIFLGLKLPNGCHAIHIVNVSGHFEVWEGNAHSSTITSMELLRIDQQQQILYLVTGSEDGFFKAWEIRGNLI